jgi:hypothetical protein
VSLFTESLKTSWPRAPPSGSERLVALAGAGEGMLGRHTKRRRRRGCKAAGKMEKRARKDGRARSFTVLHEIKVHVHDAVFEEN